MSKRITGLPSTSNDEFQLTLDTLLDRGAAIQPNSEFVTALKNGGTHRMTQRELKDRSDKMSLALAGFGIRPGDIVGTFMWSNANHVIIHRSLPLMGAVIHTLNIRLHPNELAYIIQHATDKIIFIDNDILPLFQRIPANALSKVELFIISKETGVQLQTNIKTNLPFQKCIEFDEFVAKYSKIGATMNYKYPKLTENTGCLLCYTSGTTGKPKGALGSHRSLYLSILQMQSCDGFSISGSDSVLAIVPMFHGSGWLQCYVGMTFGNKVLLTGNVNNFEHLLDLCLYEKCTVILGVPIVMQSFRHTLTANPQKYKPMRGVLRSAICGGSSPSRDLISWFWDNWKIQLIQLWGMTEAGIGTIGKPMVRRTDVDKPIKNQILENSTKPGLMMPGIKYKIVDPDHLDKQIEHDGHQMGELLVIGPCVVKKYFRADAPHKFDDNGWLRTGDICSFNTDQSMVVKDRQKDVIKSGGEWISSMDMENYIMVLTEIDKACVVAVSSEKYGERPVVIVQLFEGQKCSEEKIMDHLRKKYANFQLVDDILYWKEIPLTGTGKMSKKDVRNKLKSDNYVLRDPPLRKVMREKSIQSKL